MNILFGTSKKHDKQMRLLAGAEAMKNRAVFFSALKIDPANITSGLLVHGKTVAVVNNKNLGKIIPDTDALVTNLNNICLTITIADCVPIFFIDKKHGAIGIAHAGWKGVLKKIAFEVIETMTQAYSSNPADIEIQIGPHILGCHFEVQADVAKQFSKYSDLILNREGKKFVNLQSVIKQQLIEAGVNPENIHLTKECTFCNQDYFSYRRDKPEDVKSQVAYIIKRD
ncbi:MAG: peptidoglycan editing factor PgeF [Candidatus Uhrbacteria bacterium]|nr:peptidoglycan editing factor PgeF [Candidatus Uhrbacteria bacterium]